MAILAFDAKGVKYVISSSGIFKGSRGFFHAKGPIRVPNGL